MRKSVKKSVGPDGGWPEEMDGGVQEVGVQAKLEKEALEGARNIGRTGGGERKKFSEELIREQVSRQRGEVSLGSRSRRRGSCE